MRLMPLESWADMLAPLAGTGRRLGYVRGEFGNVGDTLQERAAFEMFQAFDLDVTWLGPVPDASQPWAWDRADGRWDGRVGDDIDELLLFGGGNMGVVGGSVHIRQKAVKTGLPITILPNSWRAAETVANCRRYYARESGSLQFRPDAVLMPDLGLGLEFDESLRARAPWRDLGVFLRHDKEARFSGAVISNQGAPFDQIDKRDVDGYLMLAASCRRIVTDALHFAIAGLMCGREVHLAPGQYHKNRSMFASWLQSLGCLWAEDPRDVEGVL